MGSGFFPFSIIRHFHGHGRGLPGLHAFRAALVLLFARPSFFHNSAFPMPYVLPDISPSSSSMSIGIAAATGGVRRALLFPATLQSR